MQEHEPYFIVRTQHMLLFDEGFVYYGFDKVEQAHRMFCLGTQLVPGLWAVIFSFNSKY